MVQGILGGGTSYEGQSFFNIKNDVYEWDLYTERKKKQLIEKIDLLKSNGFWNEIPWNFQQTVKESLFCMETFKSDFKIIKSAFEKNYITKREVKLLAKIGRNAIEFNRAYGESFKEEFKWRKYGNPDFEVANSIYCEGRDFFVTLQDAANAASRLEDYMSDTGLSNITILGNSYNTNIQQGQQNNMIINSNNNSELQDILDVLKNDLENNLPDDEITDAQEYIETIEHEVNSEKPKRKILKFATDSLIALKWGTDALASITKISQFIAPFL